MPHISLIITCAVFLAHHDVATLYMASKDLIFKPDLGIDDTGQ